MIFHYKSKLKIRQLIELSNQKKINILDFGCGIGNWSSEDLKLKSVKNVTLFDIDKKLIKILKKKYPQKKVKINFDYKKIVNQNTFNLVLFSSVIQYISQKKLKKIIYDLSKNKKNLVIVINDIPFLPRIIEFFLLPFFNFKRFLFALSLIFSKNYTKMNFHLYKKNNFQYYRKKFKIRFLMNLHDLKYLRYSIIMALK